MEFALVAPVVLVMFMTAIEVGRALWIRASLQFAVEEAARYVIVNTDDCNSTAEAQAQNAVLGLDGSSFSFSAVSSVSGSMNFCEISITYDYTVITPMVPFSATFTARSRVPTGST